MHGVDVVARLRGFAPLRSNRRPKVNVRRFDASIREGTHLLRLAIKTSSAGRVTTIPETKISITYPHRFSAISCVTNTDRREVALLIASHTVLSFDHRNRTILWTMEELPKENCHRRHQSV